MARYRLLIVVVALGAMLLVAPATSEACGFFDCLFGGCGRTTYAPATVAAVAPAYAPGCSTCSTQTVAYVPQTYYRTAYRSMPVAVYRPTTYWARQSRLVPYTTNRLVYSRPYTVAYGYAPAVSCNPCGTSACGFAGDSGCSSCSVGTTYSEAPTSAPAIAPADNGQPQPTFQQETKKVPTTPVPKLQPIPETGTQMNSTQSAPKLIDPENRTTAIPIRQAVHISQVSRPQHGGVDSGWRASRD